jgi:hypothetical protein
MKTHNVNDIMIIDRFCHGPEKRPFSQVSAFSEKLSHIPSDFGLRRGISKLTDDRLSSEWICV